MNRTIRVAFCGVAAALEIVLLFLTNLVPTATIALPALAGVLLPDLGIDTSFLDKAPSVDPADPREAW